MTLVFPGTLLAQVEVNLLGEVWEAPGGNGANTLIMSSYDPATALTVVDTLRPYLCLSSSELVPSGVQGVLLDGNALPGAGQRIVGPRLPMQTARYTTVPGVGTSFDVTLAGNGFGPAYCYQAPAVVPAGLPNEPALCSGTLTEDLPADPAIFVTGFEESSVRFARRFVVEGEWLSYRIDIQMAPGSTKPTRIRFNEWFPANQAYYPSVLGTIAGTEVTDATCTGWNAATCDGLPSKNFLALPSTVMSLWNSYLPEDAGESGQACIRLTGRRKLSVGTPAMQSAPYGFGVTEYGAGAPSLVNWVQLPASP